MIEFDIGAVLQSVAEGARAEAAPGTTVSTVVDPTLPRAVVGDEDRVRRALQLLASHALHVSRDGGVTLTARADRRTRDRLVVAFEVSDDGPGLLAADDGVFPISGDIRTGESVDLALWKQTMHLVADEVGVRTGVERGNTIWFTVEFLVDPKSASTRRPGDCRVLVVEDNLVNQKVAMRMIEKLGYAVEVVADGQAAVEALEKQDYDLVLMDCQMPVMDGYAATEEIRRREGDRRHTPIVALTAHAVEANRRRCLEIGMDDFVTKPVTSDQLRRVLEDWIPGSAG